jgi:CelD/BcsL family acetyltransferase involved in cellulose biosynthesis
MSPAEAHRIPSISVIPDELEKSGNDWNEFIRRSGANPFLFSGFVKEIMALNRARGWSPLLLSVIKDRRIIGVAPLMTRVRYGIRQATLLPTFFADLAFEDPYRELCIRLVLEYVFQRVHCAVLHLTLPAESPNVDMLRVSCERSGTSCYVHPTSGHTIIRVEGTWNEFQQARGRNFRKYFRALDRRFHRSGSCRILRLNCDGTDPAAIERVHHVEKVSWKETDRKCVDETDEDLSVILKGSMKTAGEPGFRCWGCFLELDGRTLAYALVLEYKKVGILSKTSFDESFRKYYPGTYVLNESVRRLFDDARVASIDFVTDMPFHRRWSSKCLGRVRITMCRGHFLSLIIRLLVRNPHRRRVFGRILSMAHSVPIVGPIALSFSPPS